jgi:hypothetical protein
MGTQEAKPESLPQMQEQIGLQAEEKGVETMIEGMMMATREEWLAYCDVHKFVEEIGFDQFLKMISNKEGLKQ